MNSRIDAALGERDPEQIVISDGEVDLSAAQMRLKVEQISQLILQHKLVKVALYCDNSTEWVALDLACQRLSVVVLPLPLFFSDIQIEHALIVSGIDKVVVTAALKCRTFLNNFELDTELTQGLILYKAKDSTLYHSANLPPTTQKITFTSGSTGSPKGVCLSLEQQLQVADSLVKRVKAMPVKHLCLLPLSTLLENIGGVYAPLLGGGSVVVPPLSGVGVSGSSGVDGQVLLAAIKRHRPNSVILLPQLLTLLVTAMENGWQAPDSLKFIAVGGGVVSSRMIEKAVGFGLPVHQGYGLSECASVVSLNDDSLANPGGVGQALEHVSVEIEEGEIIVSGNTFLGYVNEPASWEQAKVYTGDLGEIDGKGNIKVTGRRKNLQVSSFGRNLNPEWIESELLASSLILQAAVYTEAKPWCSALIYPSSSGVTDQEIENHLQRLNQNLPDYAQIKTWLRIKDRFSVSNQQLTNNGRLRRENIYASYADAIDQIYQRPTEKRENVVL